MSTTYLRSNMPAMRKARAFSALLALSAAAGPAACDAQGDLEPAGQVAGDGKALEAGEDFCWKRTQTRGAGTIPDQCPSAERDGALCYPSCADGYSGVGPVCWQDCPQGTVDDGAFCRHPGEILSADNSRCPWYDVCGVTVARGCSICPVGYVNYVNDGCTCRIDPHSEAKRSYGRTAGALMSCASGLQADAGLCYPPCSDGYTGVGPVCWGACPAEAPTDCGAACGASAGICAVYITEMTQTSLELALRIAALAGAGGSFTGVSVPLSSGQREALRSLLVEAMATFGGDLPAEAYENIADTLITALVTGSEVDWTSLDPLGVAALVKAFNPPICD